MSACDLRRETADLLRQVFYGNDICWSAELTADAFFQDATAQGMAPLLFRRIAAQGCAWPAALLASLREAALHQAAAELRLELDLRALLKAFVEAEIRPLLLKGTAVAYTLYPEPWLRPRCDTDLLVAEPERAAAEALLLRLGYKPLLEMDAAHLGFGSQMCYAKIVRGVRLNYDLHWQISHINRQFSRRFAESGLAAAPVPALGEHARALGRVDSLIHACFHRAGHFSHSGDRLIWLHDIHLLCQSLSSQEAETFCGKARQLEIVALCADAIAAAAWWFNTALLPPLAALTQAQAGNEALAALLDPGGRRAGVKNHALLELQGLTTWRERLHFLFQNAFPPPEYMLWRYSRTEKSALPLLYLRRCAEAVSIFLKR